MKWPSALILPVFLGGCLAPSFQDNPHLTGSVPGRGAATGSPAEVTANGTGRGESPETVVIRHQGASLLEGDALLGMVDEEALAEELPDVETLEDNFLLSGVAEDPPEDEGETVRADEIFFDFPVVENEKVHYYVDYFTGTARPVFTRWLERSGRYLPMMRQIFAEEGVPQDLVYLAMVESGFNNRAYSWAHAVGPWQFIASTGKMYGMDSDWWRDERRDFEKATRAAARFLRDLHVRFDGDWYLAVASYNAGPGKLQRAIQMYETRDFWEISRHSYLAAETKNYLPKLLAVLLIAKEPEKYGFVDVAFQDPVAFDTVVLPTATDLEIVARFAEVPYEEVKNLNPELKRWCSPPYLRNYELRLPAGAKEKFERRYALLPERERANYKMHQVKKGDTLLAIASRYDIRVDDILSLNKVSNPRSLRIGQDLILPLHQGLSRLPLEELKDDHARSVRKTTYTVRKGDTLSQIARKYGVSEKELRSLNKLGNKSLIRTGQALTVVQGRSSTGAVAGTSQGPTNGAARPAEKRLTYQVQPGDSLWKIANRHGVTTHQLREWNRLPPKHTLQPGQKLSIVAQAGDEKQGKRRIVYQVRPGDTLWDISRRFDVATREIMDWNNLGNSDVLRPGDKLTLLVQNEKKG
ncbi:MAG: LysM peptidoglycan-binding domain-containing protein [Desulfuromonadales bacterium]|nr:LysM peptidoglycan-binding domain-containing protein [Desulfuromonadales bacterium]